MTMDIKMMKQNGISRMICVYDERQRCKESSRYISSDIDDLLDRLIYTDRKGIEWVYYHNKKYKIQYEDVSNEYYIETGKKKKVKRKKYHYGGGVAI